MSTMREKLEKLHAQVLHKFPEEFTKAKSHEIERVIKGEKVHGLETGEKAPNFTLSDAMEKQITLSDNLRNGPVILTFYRGSW